MEFVSSTVAGGHYNHGDHGEVCIRSEPFHHDESISGGQTQIEKDQVRLDLARFAYRRDMPESAKLKAVLASMVTSPGRTDFKI